jgi:hypothetical protein
MSSRKSIENEIAEVRAMLVDLPATWRFERSGLQARLEDLERQLTLAHADRQVGRAEIHFDGAPVVGQLGVEASFAAEALAEFGRAVDHQAKRMGQLPGRLFFTGHVLGSFGFVLEELEQRRLVEHGPSAVALATESLAKLIGAAPRAKEEAFTSASFGIAKFAFGRTREFLQRVQRAGASCGIITHEQEVRLTAADVHAGAQRMTATRVEEATQWYFGKLSGLFTEHPMRFQHVSTTRRKLEGVVDPAVDRASIATFFGSTCYARIRTTTVLRGGKRRHLNVLLEARSEEDHLEQGRGRKAPTDSRRR